MAHLRYLTHGIIRKDPTGKGGRRGLILSLVPPCPEALIGLESQYYSIRASEQGGDRVGDQGAIENSEISKFSDFYSNSTLSTKMFTHIYFF